MTNYECSGRPGTLTSSDVTVIKELLNKDRRIKLRELAARIECSYGKVFNIVDEQMNMRWICARWIPKMLTENQKRMRKKSCKRIMGRVLQERPNFLERIVTVDETWISFYMPATTQQSTMWKMPAPPPPPPPRSLNRPSLPRNRCVSSPLMSGVVLAHVVLQGQTVNAAYFT